MYIEEVIIDGFKSYATRTVVSGFDPSFNAITGLNGSGKSNILDSICFVLGITNLTQVRASNLQDLVYKQGQAGVTKASVSIVFNNENVKQSPVGYEQYNRITVTRQVVIGGRNKYLINGHNAQAQKVQNLFHSVQLNVNNPHFLIMQGRITKVINMKPPEILAMIEEAAGTRMFEMKKQAALKTIAKKEKKVEEIEKILREEITPTLENLERERSHYTKYLKNQSEIEALSRFSIAFEYTKAQETLKVSSTDLVKMEQDRVTLQEREEEAKAELSQCKQKHKELLEQKDKEMEGGCRNLEKRADAFSKELVKISSELKHLQESLQSEEQKRKSLVKNTAEAKQALEKKTKEHERLVADVSKVEEKNRERTNALADLQKQYQALSTGLSSDPDGEKTLTAQLMDAEKEMSNAVTEGKQAAMKVEHVTAQLKEKRAAAKTVGHEYQQMAEKVESATKTVQALQKQLEALPFQEHTEQQLLGDKRKEEAIVMRLREEVDQLRAQLTHLDFSYSDPAPGFDRNRVKGLVAKLITVQDPQATLALEVTAGGRLFNVVVNTEETGKLLLKNGKLTKRVTIIPLNKITARSISAGAISAAEKLVGADRARVALSLVGFDDDVEAAMQYVFGSTFICQDSEAAKKVTFSDNISSRSVTLEGDVFDPSGTLTGGSRPTTSSILDKLQQLNEKEEQLEQHEQTLHKLQRDLDNLRKTASAYHSKKQEYELKKHELDLLKERIGQNAHHQLIEKVKDLENQLETAKETMATCAEREKKATKLRNDLQNQVKNFGNTRESRLKDLEKRIAAAKKDDVSSTKEVKARQQEVEQSTLELEDLQTELAALAETSETVESSIATLQQQVKEKTEVAREKKEEFDEAQQELDEKRQSLASCDKSIAVVLAERDKISQELSDIDIELKKIEHKITRFHKDQKDASKYVEHLEEKHSWISKEKQYFGKPQTDYDFKARNPTEVQRELTKLQEEQMKLNKQINKKVMSMFEKAEQEYKDLMEKKRIIENDKEKIEAVIRELDDKKNEALKTTWQKVNKDFGSIFATLLPGTTAKLEPPEGASVLEGLEMKVAFSGIWKESLSELSGGQRSLLALSLILALLLFKPAPMYILDEIDAALDLSHTQNIGQMLRTHFSHSQFIIVSLKEDMFRNANVLFRTKFVDGVSTVTRTKRTTK